MKSRVDQSTASFIITIVVIALLLGALYLTCDTYAFIALAIIIIATLGFCLFYSPLSISADESSVRINSPLKIHEIAMQRIVSVERFLPTMGAIRICGSGGFLGYWGLFREGDVGNYMAYYGKASDCFLIRLDTGKKYVLGCKDADAMVDYIQKQIKH
jgi:Bacterial PH domain